MKKLVSKIQHHYFEKGDFDEIKERDLPETISLIHAFPWEQQRREIALGLNGPSVTMENGNGLFLKIGLYYNGRFIIYHLDSRNNLTCCIIDKLEDADKIVEGFFEDRLEKEHFQKYRDWIYRKKDYFRTGKFEYHFRLKNIMPVMIFPLIMLLLLIPNFFLFGVGNGRIPLILVIPLFLFFSGTQWSLFFNHYFFSRKLHIKISKGVDTFYFGRKGELEVYRKKDIRTIRTFNNKGYRNPWSEFYIFEIEFRNGEILKFTNLIMSSSMLAFKFPEVIINDKHINFPIIRKDKLKTI